MNAPNVRRALEAELGGAAVREAPRELAGVQIAWEVEPPDGDALASALRVCLTPFGQSHQVVGGDAQPGGDLVECLEVGLDEVGLDPRDGRIGETAELGELLWLECNATELNGVSFTKGCYVGQENTARMNWRQKVNRRLVVTMAAAPTARAKAFYPELGLAVEHRLRTIAFPAISCGAYGYPVESASSVAVGAVTAFLQVEGSIERVLFVCLGSAVRAAYEEALRER